MEYARLMNISRLRFPKIPVRRESDEKSLPLELAGMTFSRMMARQDLKMKTLGSRFAANRKIASN